MKIQYILAVTHSGVNEVITLLESMKKDIYIYLVTPEAPAAADLSECVKNLLRADRMMLSAAPLLSKLIKR